MTKNNTAQALTHAASIGILCYSSGHPIASSLAQLSRKILDGSIVPAKSACGFRASAETVNAAKAAHVAALIASNDAGHGATLWRKQSREFNALVLEAWGVDAKTRKRKACSVPWEEITPQAKAAKAAKPASVGALVKAAQAKTSTHATPPAPFAPIKAAKATPTGIDALRAQVERITAEIARAEAQAEAQAKAAKAAKAEAAKAEAAARAAAQAEAAKREQIAAAVKVHDQDIERMISDLATLAPYGVAPEGAHLVFVLSGRKVSIPLPGDDVASILGLLA